MAASNVDVVRRAYEAWNGPDPVEGVIPLLHEEFEWVNPPYAVESGTRSGRNAWRESNATLAAAFDEFRHEVGEMVDAGDVVVCFATFVARGRGGAIAYEKLEPQVWTLRDGLVIRFQWFHDRAEALAAAGLPAD